MWSDRDLYEEKISLVHFYNKRKRNMDAINTEMAVAHELDIPAELRRIEDELKAVEAAADVQFVQTDEDLGCDTEGKLPTVH